MDNIKQIIAKNIADLRKRKKYTQTDVANLLGYSDKAVSKWEKGDSLPDIEVLYELCNIYGVTLDYLTREGSFEDKKNLLIPQYETRNKILIILIASTVIWLIAVSVFVYCDLYKHIEFWPIYVWAIPANALVVFYFNLRWGLKLWKMPILSVFAWSLIASVYLQMLYNGQNMWAIFLIGIPIQIALVLWSQLKHT